MKIYALKNGISAFNSELKKETGINTDFFTLQVVFDINVSGFKSTDYDKFILIHLPISSIESDSNIKKITVEYLDKIDSTKTNSEDVELYAINIDDMANFYLINSVNDSGNWKFDQVIGEYGIDKANSKYIKGIVSSKSLKLANLNCSSSRFPQCRYP